MSFVNINDISLDVIYLHLKTAASEVIFSISRTCLKGSPSTTQNLNIRGETGDTVSVCSHRDHSISLENG